jgi:lipoate-protein ligase B
LIATGTEFPRLDIRPHGLVPYTAGLALQEAAAREVRSGAFAGILLALRHPPTITLGRRTAPSEVHATPRDLEAMNIVLASVDRGGGATYHYPDQAVVYPILDLRRLRLSVPALLMHTGEALLATLRDFHVPGEWDPERPGIYVRGAKIASVGFHLSRELTTHGIALNIGSSWDGFRLIDPCKVPGLAITSLEEIIGTRLDADAVALELAKRLAARLRNAGGLIRKPSTGY